MSKSRILTETPSEWMDRVWRKNAPQIYKLCRSRSSDAESAKDLFQEVALRFCRFAPMLDRQRDLLPWFRSVVYNTHRDIHRRKLVATPISWLHDCCVAYAPWASKADQEIKERRRENFVRRGLDFLMRGLSSKERVTVEFSCIGGLPAREACVCCAVDKGTFFKRKSVAIRKMRANKDLYLSMLQNGNYSVDLNDLLTHASEIS